MKSDGSAKGNVKYPWSLIYRNIRNLDSLENCESCAYQDDWNLILGELEIWSLLGRKYMFLQIEWVKDNNLLLNMKLTLNFVCKDLNWTNNLG